MRWDENADVPFVGFPGEPEPVYSESSDALEHEFRKLEWAAAQRRFRAQYPDAVTQMEAVASHAALVERRYRRLPEHW